MKRHARPVNPRFLFPLLLFCVVGAGLDAQDTNPRPPRRSGRDDQSLRGQLSRISRGALETARPGVPAPQFTLPLLEDSAPPTDVRLDSKGCISLSDYRGRKPVVLIFGSYT